VTANNLELETDAERLIEAAFLSVRCAHDGWTYEKQYRIPETRKKIDYLVTAGDLRFGIECKAKLTPKSEGMKATALADHLEQAVGYSRLLELPVFIGPVIFPDSPSAAVVGGHELSSLAALNLFGGRMNVGTLIYHAYGWGQWTLSLRGRSFWQNRTGFSDTVNKLVVSEGSKKERRDL
jgi:hypothetical protein